MKTDRELDAVLAEMGRDHRAIAAPKTVEAALCAAAAGMRRATGVRRLRAAWAWGLAVLVLVAVLSGGAIWRIHGPVVRQAQTRPAPLPAPRAQELAGQAGARGDAPPTSDGSRNAGTGSARPRDASSKRSGGEWASANSLEEFVELPVGEGLPPAAELSVVRIRLLGSDLQQYGLEAPADAVARTMLAEFVVGEDGLPRAIRIVQ